MHLASGGGVTFDALPQAGLGPTLMLMPILIVLGAVMAVYGMMYGNVSSECFSLRPGQPGC